MLLVVVTLVVIKEFIQKVFNFCQPLTTIDNQPVDVVDFVNYHESGSKSAEALMVVVASMLFDVDIDVMMRREKGEIETEVRLCRFLFFVFLYT